MDQMDGRMSCCGEGRAATREEVERMVEKGRELRDTAIRKTFRRMMTCTGGLLRVALRLTVRGAERKEA